MARNVNALFVTWTRNQYIFSFFSYVCMHVCLYTHAYIRMHKYMHMHTYKCGVSWEIFAWFIDFIHVLDYPTFFSVLWRSLCRYHVYFKRWYVLYIHKPRVKHDVLPYIYIYRYVCVWGGYVYFSSHDVSLWRSRIIIVSSRLFSSRLVSSRLVEILICMVLLLPKMEVNL